MRKAGWVNIDLYGHPVDVAWNLLKPLPFPDGSVSAVFHEHVLEHFTTERGLELVLEATRVLRRGGVLRIGVPDAGAYARSYAGDRSLIETLRPGRPTALLAFQEIVFQHEHRSMYDDETLALIMRAAGLTGIDVHAFGDSRLGAVDSEHRRGETLYMEGVKPGY